MWRLFSCVLLVLWAFAFHNVVGYDEGHLRLCGNNSTRSAKSCLSQILGENHTDISKCNVEHFPPNSNNCKTMDFTDLASSNAQIGSVSLRPFLYPEEKDGYSVNHTVLNITFSNIKWNSMKFRFKPMKQKKIYDAHCSNISLANDMTISDQSVLYYDCFWPIVDGNRNGQSHILDFEATDKYKRTHRGQFYFNIPSLQMLSSTVPESQWQPFLYIDLTSTMKLHIIPPPPHLNITAYEIKVMKETGKGTLIEKTATISLKNKTSEVTYDYSLFYSGSYYFVVTPLHETCKMDGDDGCQSVESPRVIISSEVHSLNICIASITALVVASLFAYYIVLRVIRRYWCKDYNTLALDTIEIPGPPKILAIYSPANRLHAECVFSFVQYLRSEYGFDIMYDGDIPSTTHGDPFLWANEAFSNASHVLYIVGPAEEANIYNNIYDQPIRNAHQNVDTLLLSFVGANRVSKCRKDVSNVFFDHSNGQPPVETRHDKKFVLLKDWQKLVAHLSKNMMPKRQIVRTEKGRNFIEKLSRARKLLNEK